MSLLLSWVARRQKLSCRHRMLPPETLSQTIDLPALHTPLTRQVGSRFHELHRLCSKLGIDAFHDCRDSGLSPGVASRDRGGDKTQQSFNSSQIMRKSISLLACLRHVHNICSLASLTALVEHNMTKTFHFSHYISIPGCISGSPTRFLLRSVPEEACRIPAIHFRSLHFRCVLLRTWMFLVSALVDQGQNKHLGDDQDQR